VREVFNQIDPDVEVTWACSDTTGVEIQDGDFVKANGTLFEAKGRARSILTAERNALNFLQFLSGTATATKQYADAISDVPTCKILDTRKTISNFRLPQKYAVQMGGGQNHRTGLYDAFLIKENHIAACDGSIRKAVEKARQIGAEKNTAVEVEVENFKELDEALAAKVDVVMLDNFSLDEMREAMEKVKALGSGRPAVEASGNVTVETLREVALTGVDYISTGAITKNVVAADLSMRFL
jgi:nicotinate-nucleotide pyrophosphorylase (carboxylating)